MLSRRPAGYITLNGNEMTTHKFFAAWFRVWGALLCIYLLGLVVWVAAGMYFAGVVRATTLSLGEAIGLVGFGLLGVAWYGISCNVMWCHYISSLLVPSI